MDDTSLLERSLPTLTIVSAIGAAVVGGVFFAFSTFVMRALDRLPDAQGLAAMQSVNREAPSAWFMAVLFGTALSSLVVAGAAGARWDEPDARYHLVGALLYLVVVVVTVAYHVPRNDELAGVDPAAVDSAALWGRYVTGWTAWNHVRTGAAVAAAAVLAVAQRVG